MSTNTTTKLKVFSVLYVEDDNGIRDNITEILQHLFKKTYTAKNGKEAYDLYLEYKPDLIITDIKMPEMDGIEFIKKIREYDSKTRVIITSAYTDLDYLLDATQLHLIKYIIKPITEEKLMEALSSFVQSYAKSHIFVIGRNIIFDYDKSIIQNNDKQYQLTKRENRFLKILSSKKRVITYEEIENQVWDSNLVMTQNALRLFIKNFRKKLPLNTIKNVQGVGYRLVLEEDK